MVPAVEDLWAKRQAVGGNKLPLVSPEELRGQLSGIRDKAALIVLLVDLLDASGSFLGKLRDLTGRNPIVLIGTKVKYKTVSAEGSFQFTSCNVLIKLQGRGILGRLELCFGTCWYQGKVAESL